MGGAPKCAGGGLNESIPDCPKCGGRAGTTDSRQSNHPESIRRRRKKCRACGHGFTTEEIVVTKDGVGSDQAYAAARAFMCDLDELVRQHFGDDLHGVGNRVSKARRNGQ